jgi:hypothetical protein
MPRSRFRRFCVLLVFFASTIGLPLYGMQSVVMMPQLAFAVTADGSPCNDCECCGDEGMIDTSACAMLCAGMVGSLPDVEVPDLTAPTVLFAEAAHRYAGFSLAPDPSPPRLPVLT